MELNEKLVELRKQKGLTQAELAEILFVSRTAVSKWESGRGYPNIDSLKEIAGFFSVTIDELLSTDEMLTIAEEDSKQKQNHLCELIFGLLDVSALLFFLLPLFGQKIGETVHEVSHLSLNEISTFIKIAYFAVTISIALFGILILALQNCNNPTWTKNKYIISLVLNAVGTVLFIATKQPYAATFLFVFLTIKALTLIKK